MMVSRLGITAARPRQRATTGYECAAFSFKFSTGVRGGGFQRACNLSLAGIDCCCQRSRLPAFKRTDQPQRAATVDHIRRWKQTVPDSFVQRTFR